METQFRFRYTGVHFTFRGWPVLQVLVDFVISKLSPRELDKLKYVSACLEIGHAEQEGDNNENGYKHAHIALWFDQTQLYFNNARKFDLPGPNAGESTHPHIQPVSKLEHYSRIFHDYHRKQENREGWTPEETAEAQNRLLQFGIRDGVRDPTFEPPQPGDVRRRPRKGSKYDPEEVKEAFRTVNEAESLEDAAIKLAIMPHSIVDIAILKGRPSRSAEKSDYQSASFLLRPPEVIRTLYIEGRAGIGKTEWAINMLPNPILVSTIDDLRHFDPAVHRSIVFDDYDFSTCPVEQLIHLFDWGRDRSIRCRYNDARIPARTPKVIIGNRPLETAFNLGGHSFGHRGAVLRRVMRLRIPADFGPLYFTPNDTRRPVELVQTRNFEACPSDDELSNILTGFHGNDFEFRPVGEVVEVDEQGRLDGNLVGLEPFEE